MALEKLSYSLDEIEKSMADADCILDQQVRLAYRTIPERRGHLVHAKEGRFCVPFPMDDPRGHRICYRVWKEVIPDAVTRYRHIGEGLRNFSYFSNFRFVPSALRLKCDGRVMPGIVMDWIEGWTLDEFLTEPWRGLSPLQRVSFIRDFYLMCMRLRYAGISHGDLSCLNIMVTTGRELRLVDYDSVYVSSMGERFYQTTGGAPGFQHPDRLSPASPLRVSLDDDNFSQLVIALSLWVAYFDPSVISAFGESHLLFLPADLEGANAFGRIVRLRDSRGWKAAQRVSGQSKHIKALMDALESAVKNPLSKVPSLIHVAPAAAFNASASGDFYQILTKGSPAPERPVAAPSRPAAPAPKVPVAVAYCTACGTRFASDQFRFCTACGTPRHTFIPA